MSKELAVGDELPSVSMRPTALQLFRYSAVTWNTHRIHYDPDWAKREGHAGVLVHSHLHAANALRVLTDGLGPEWVIRSVSYRIVAPAPAGDTLKATATICCNTTSYGLPAIEMPMRSAPIDGVDLPRLALGSPLTTSGRSLSR